MRIMDLGVWRGGPRQCEHCQRSKLVIMQFHRDDSVWLVTFLDWTSKLPLGKQWQLDGADAVEGLVKRSRTDLRGAACAMFKHALAAGVGEVQIEVSGEQYARIRG